MSIRPARMAGRPGRADSTTATTPPELVVCPECGGTAEIIWHRICGSTAGPVDHAFVLCPAGHHFLMPAAALATSG